VSPYLLPYCNDPEDNMPRNIKHAAMLAAFAIFAAPAAHADEAMAQKMGCLACHGIDHAIVGPAFEDIAEKYRGDAAAPETLTQKVLNGGAGVWGEVMMPPNVAVSPEGARELVDWVLSLGGS
jgi:cytochrome c